LYFDEGVRQLILLIVKAMYILLYDISNLMYLFKRYVLYLSLKFTYDEVLISDGILFQILGPVVEFEKLKNVIFIVKCLLKSSFKILFAPLREILYIGI